MSISTDEILSKYVSQLNSPLPAPLTDKQVDVKDFLNKIVNTLIENKELTNTLLFRLDSFSSTMNTSNNKSTNTIVSNVNRIKNNINTLFGTTIINNKNIVIRGSVNILNVKTTGKIKELLVKSSSKIGIYILTDNKEIYNFNSKFDDLTLLSEYSDAISAIITPDDKYVIYIKDIKFKHSIKIDIILDELSNSILDNVFCIYDSR